MVNFPRKHKLQQGNKEVNTWRRKFHGCGKVNATMAL